jgi:hypothetical protein
MRKRFIRDVPQANPGTNLLPEASTPTSWFRSRQRPRSRFLGAINVQRVMARRSQEAWARRQHNCSPSSLLHRAAVMLEVARAKLCAQAHPRIVVSRLVLVPEHEVLKEAAIGRIGFALNARRDVRKPPHSCLVAGKARIRLISAGPFIAGERGLTRGIRRFRGSRLPACSLHATAPNSSNRMEGRS